MLNRRHLYHTVTKNITNPLREPFISVLGSIARRQKSGISNIKNRPQVCWLDLNGSGLSAIERLCLEEALLRHDPLNRSWAIAGTHDPIYNTRLKLDTHYQNVMNNRKPNEKCIVIMGIGGKPERLLNIEKVKDDGVLVIKRFSGGGTVVVDHSSLWTTFIGRTSDFPHVPPYPKEIMKWSADYVFQDVFQRLEKSFARDGNGAKKTLVVDTKSCGLASTHKQKEVSSPSKDDDGTQQKKFKFNLRENDYVLGDHKMGGNAQSITSGAWLHHTSFLWDYENDNMEYLTLPDKRPAYRGDRRHDDFLVKLKTVYGKNYSDVEGKRLFFTHLKVTTQDAFDLREVSLSEALEVVDNELGGFQNWFQGKCRTKIVQVI